MHESLCVIPKMLFLLATELRTKYINMRTRKRTNKRKGEADRKRKNTTVPFAGASRVRSVHLPFRPSLS